MHALEQMWAVQLLRLLPGAAGGGAAGGAGGGGGGEGGAFDFTSGGTAVACRGGATRYATYLKISAGALGGAALLALTGGLAAPAIAAGLGSAIVALQGGAAAATAVTTMGASTAGIAAITGTFGVIGASHAGSKAADLYGDLREFGFWSISAPSLLPPPPSSPMSPEEVAEGELRAARRQRAQAAPAELPPAADCTGAGAGGGSDDGAGDDGRGSVAVRCRHADGEAPVASGDEAKATASAASGPSGLITHVSAGACRASDSSSGGGGGGGGGGCGSGSSTGTSGDAHVGSSGGGALPPALLQASRSDPKLARDGLFVPALLLESCAGDDASGGGGSGGRGGDGGGGGAGDPLTSPAALFMLSPVAPFPPPSPALPAREEPEAGKDGERGAAGQRVGAPAQSMAPALGADAAAAAAADTASGGASDSVDDGDRPLRSHACQVDGGSVSGEDEEYEDPWSAELAEAEAAAASAPPSVVMRARIAASGGGDAAVETPYVEALLAEMDAEEADLDGDDVAAAAATAGSSGGAAAADAAAATVAPLQLAQSALGGGKKGSSGGGGAVAPAPAASAAAASGSGSIWRWFRSGKSAGPASSSGGGAAAASVASPRCKASKLRPLLRVPVDPRRSGDATLALTIAVNGWVKRPEDFVEPWRPLPSGGSELWGLVWESDVLTSLGGALRRFIRDKAIEESSKMVLRLSVSTALVTAMMLPMAVMSAINITIGSRWRVALRRAQLAGRCLAHLLMQGAHGDRPVTLIGFSMGARLIFHCLLELSRCGARGLVESAILLGTPVSANEARWRQARSAVSGRLVNAFSANDWVLGVVFRAHSRASLALRAAGTGPVAVAGVENTNLSALIAGHTQYLEKLDEVLSALNLQA